MMSMVGPKPVRSFACSRALQAFGIKFGGGDVRFFDDDEKRVRVCVRAQRMENV